MSDGHGPLVWPEAVTVDLPAFVMRDRDDLETFVAGLIHGLDGRTVREVVEITTIINGQVVQARSIDELFKHKVEGRLDNLSIRISAPISRNYGPVVPHLLTAPKQLTQFLFGPPVPAEEIGRWIIEFRRRPLDTFLYVNAPSRQDQERIVSFVTGFGHRRQGRFAGLYRRSCALFCMRQGRFAGLYRRSCALFCILVLAAFTALSPAVAVVSSDEGHRFSAVSTAFIALQYVFLVATFVVYRFIPPAVILPQRRHWNWRALIQPALFIVVTIVVLILSARLPAATSVLLVTAATILQDIWATVSTYAGLRAPKTDA